MKTTIPYTINVRGRLIDLSQPQIMGILNCTPDSFYAGSRVQTEREIALRAHEIAEQQGDIADIGAFSTRPGAAVINGQEEMERLRFALSIVRRERPDLILSVDTFRPDVARMCVEEWGVDIINDVALGLSDRPSELSMYRSGPLVAGGSGAGHASAAPTLTERGADEACEMFRMMARLKVPYILMSLKPTLESMLMSFSADVRMLRDLGVKDIIVDPGFGFGKTLQQNYEVLAGMERLSELDVPVLVGVSRKKMIYELIGTDADGSLNGTSILNTMALLKGAAFLRVHDVKEAVEVRRIVCQTLNSNPFPNSSSL